MSYALTVVVCTRQPMGYQTLHPSVQNATVNKDYDRSFIALLTIRIKPRLVTLDASNVSVQPPCGISALSRKEPYFLVRVCTTRDSTALALSRSENHQYLINIQPLVLWLANLLPETSDIPILTALCTGLYSIYNRVICLLYLTSPAKFEILGL